MHARMFNHSFSNIETSTSALTNAAAVPAPTKAVVEKTSPQLTARKSASTKRKRYQSEIQDYVHKSGRIDEG